MTHQTRKEAAPTTPSYATHHLQQKRKVKLLLGVEDIGYVTIEHCLTNLLFLLLSLLSFCSLFFVIHCVFYTK